MKTLNDLKTKECARVVKIAGAGAVRRRLFDMGLTPNTEVLVRKTAPMGDPVEIVIRGYELSLRKSEAELVIIER
ncbi:MAG: ferrous iron transport protein A [Opitutales bacterium]|nr:ferrous iron transport protein A [Opitutales bacterium]